ncbi:MAG: endo-1,4-beta-xylanase [Anaerolineaceae bacterium]|jgi:endo-1,4-beta-xylanase
MKTKPNFWIHLLGTIVVASLILANCSPKPSGVPALTQPTASAIPSAILSAAATLYSGPGNVGYETLAQLPKGSQVFPGGTYVDFVKVDVSVNGTELEGYIQKDALEGPTAGLPELSLQQVPWQPVDVMNNFLNNSTTFDGDQVTIDNTSDSYLDSEGLGMPMDSPFRFTAKMAPQNTDYGVVKLLGIPEAVSGNWWQGTNRIDIAVQAGKLILGIRDGTTDGENKTFSLGIPSNQPFTFVSNDPQGKSITILDENGKNVLTVDLTSLAGVHLPDGIFAKQMLYLGLSSAPHSTLVVSSILFEKAPSGKAQPETQTLPTLPELAKQNGITMGTEFSIYNMRDPRAWSILKQDFDIVAIDEFSSTSVWKGRGEYDFSSIDAAVSFALNSGLKIRASHLIFGATENSTFGIPEWLKNSNYSRQEYIQILQEYITAVVSRYKGKVAEWSIANEAIGRSFYPGTDFWNDKIGPEYIEIAFRAARAADPNGILIFNGDNNESPRDASTTQNVDKTYQTVKTLKAKGVPIDVVGMEMHLFTPWNSKIPPQKQDVIDTMRRFGDLGVKVYITEIDVNVHTFPGSQTDKWKYQADLYRNMMEACLESGVCASFTTWGISDGTSAITTNCNGCLNIPDAAPLMFDADYNPKPAYFAIRDALQQGLQTIPTVTPTP